VLTSTEDNYEDPSLANWVEIAITDDPWCQPAKTVVKEGWPFVYLYCFPLNTTVRGKTVECPPFVHRINATERFNTSDLYFYSPSAVEIISRNEILVTDVDSINFRNVSYHLDDNHAIHKVIQLKKQLIAANNRLYAVQLDNRRGISYSSVPISLAVFWSIR
jgi:hypothetical protein